MRSNLHCLSLFSCLFVLGCNSANHKTSTAKIGADSILKNARFYTMNAKQPWAEVVAVDEGRIIYVGNWDGAQKLVGNDTEIIDLGGHMAMPGLIDAHIHPTRGGIKNLYECNFPFSATPDEISTAVAKCVASQPDAVWIRGGQWNSGFFETYKIGSPREFLDKVSGDKAVFLNDDSNHNGWVNSKALALAGLTKDTPDPDDGKYGRNPKTGKLNGLLFEGAEQSLFDSLPDWSAAQYESGVLEAARTGNQFGITAMKDANSNIKDMAAYQATDQSGKLHMHMVTSIKTPYGQREAVLDYDKIDDLRDKYKSKHVQAGAVKLYMDGVPTSSRTAAMLAPYTAADGEAPHNGMLHVEAGLMTRDVVELDKRGYTIKIHAAGDRSVRVSLDAIAAARKINGSTGKRHEIAHAGYIDPSDITRFEELNAVADLSPYLWHPSPIIDSVVGAVGSPRGEEYWPIKDLIEANAPILAGSDWPAAVASMDPWAGIEAMVTRADPRGKTPGSFWPQQAITLKQALHIFTIDGSKAMGLEAEIGSLEIGKFADIIVLDQNILELKPSEINQVKIVSTFFEGKIVYSADEINR